MTEIKYGIKYF